jgi:hypothetical protein
MPSTRSHHRTSLRILATGVVVVVSGGLIAACGSGPGAQAEAAGAPAVAVAAHEHSGAGHDMASSHGPRTASQVALYQAMQNLWQQHMEWTYAAVVAFAVDSPAFPATADRLLQNQVDIGDAVRPFYGDAAADQLTTLLQDHITGAVAILQAAKAGDSAAQDQAVTAEYANANAIGDFLAAANPANWAKADMEAMMTTHIDQTLVYATDLLTGDYAQGIADYGTAEAHMVEMGDMLSAGIVNQFPKQFKK